MMNAADFSIPSDCWQTIGYKGDRSCPKLDEYVHCRSCPLFARAGHSLYDREAPAGYTEEWADILSREKEHQLAGVFGAVAFRLGKERLALNAKLFAGVLDPRPVRLIPHKTDKLLKGLTVVHGEILPLVSVRELLDIPPEKTDGEKRAARRYIAVNKNDERFVFAADEVTGLVRYAPDEPRPVPVTLAKSPASYTRGILERRGHTINLLDDELFFNALRRCVG